MTTDELMRLRPGVILRNDDAPPGDELRVVVGSYVPGVGLPIAAAGFIPLETSAITQMAGFSYLASGDGWQLAGGVGRRATNDTLFAERDAALEAALKPRLDDAFLALLNDAVRTCGWSVDHTESAAFVAWCFRLAGKPVPDLEPFNTP